YQLNRRRTKNISCKEIIIVQQRVVTASMTDYQYFILYFRTSVIFQWIDLMDELTCKKKDLTPMLLL
ncbi:MAG: hypothetical protein AABZ36_00070, partial [Nitrospirota bacterium]